MAHPRPNELVQDMTGEEFLNRGRDLRLGQIDLERELRRAADGAFRR